MRSCHRGKSADRVLTETYHEVTCGTDEENAMSNLIADFDKASQRRDLPDSVLAPMWSASFTDSRWVREAFPGCVAYGFAPFPGESLRAMQGGRDHMPDERIAVGDVTYQALFFERVARDLLA